MTNKPLLLAFSLAAGLMSSTAMAADFGATSGMNRDVTPVVFEGRHDIAVWDNSGSVADRQETSDRLTTDKIGTFGKVDANAAGSALVATILSATKADIKTVPAEAMIAVPRTDKYDVTAVATVALAAPLTKVDTTRVDAIKYATFDRADTVSADKPIVAAADIVVTGVRTDKAEKVDSSRTDKVAAAKVDVADSRVSSAALQQISRIDVVADQKAAIDETVKVASLAKSDLSSTKLTQVGGDKVDLSDIQKQADSLTKQIDALNAQEGVKGADVKALEEQISQLKKELESLRDKAGNLDKSDLGKDGNVLSEQQQKELDMLKDQKQDLQDIGGDIKKDTQISSSVFGNLKTERLNERLGNDLKLSDLDLKGGK